ncbi:P-loop containing nucleoside triphosphate hydrolase protein [Aspergillus ellipticus CBS 707.79]|uniref:P-loop containing nucleoside triphosphate hydrolase protein n=1 Tax=Aspergillus ellipticus CBS 707.79 TaxID=1448320 RepID=A0A319EG47_9EURO|nr:P-loop containing nucleoside triphosphate hydrolase protein [Aspergillus ellipticus CBS 707.79]
MITTSADTRMTFIEELATERGLQMIRQIVETDFSISYSVLKPMFNPHCVLFLRLVSHDEIMKSLLLEKAVGTIYNVIYGPSGRPGMAFLKGVTKYLVDARAAAVSDGASTQTCVHWIEALLLTSKVLLSILNFNQEAAIHRELKGIVEGLCSCCHDRNTSGMIDEYNFGLAQENVVKISDILEMGDSLCISKVIDRLKTVTLIPDPVEPMDLPGELSDLGPRHDNDHAVISRIRILPTMSEILSNGRDEFLPPQNSLNSQHETGVCRLVDTHFRLLREDTSGLVRDAMRLIMHNWEFLAQTSDWRPKHKFLRQYSPTPVRIYTGAQIQRVKAEQYKGIEVDMEFDQLHRLKNMNPMRRKQWWLDTRALRMGGPLVALLDAEDLNDAHAIFFLVSRKEVCFVDRGKQSESASACVSDVVSNADRAMVTLRLATANYELDANGLLSMVRERPVIRKRILIEFPAVPYNSFEGILRCLQSLYEHPWHIPFAPWLAPSIADNEFSEGLATDHTETNIMNMPPPTYFHNYVTLDLSALPRRSPSNNGIAAPLSMSLSQDPQQIAAQLYRETTLDEGQATAMVSALRRKIALIQGPPGTGKSYVGLQLARCLLGNQEVLGLGPILCVCFTAHALDQFLDGIHKSGVQNIIRIGPPSAFPHIDALSLDVRKREPAPRVACLARARDDARGKLSMLSGKIENLLETADKDSWSLVMSFLRKRLPSSADSINPDSHEKDNDAIREWASGDVPDWSDTDAVRSIEQLLGEDNLWTMRGAERACLLRQWQDAAWTELTKGLSELLKCHSEEKKKHTWTFAMAELQRLNSCQVVGITTTQLANNADLVRNIGSKVLICEEAGEVLESHTLITLLPSIQHAILIGDHLQLRPRISNSRLSVAYDQQGPKYNLDESLFERLANYRFRPSNPEFTAEGNAGFSFPVAQLNHQRRMHPSISDLVRSTLYSNLKDHPTTASYPGISGMRQRLFWLDHQNEEDPGDPAEPMQSKTNAWEVRMVTELVRHLTRQGKYLPGEIAVLTPYVAQLRMLKDVLGKEMALIISGSDRDELEESEEAEASERYLNEGVGRTYLQRNMRGGSLLEELRLSTVDNFQGEEATIIIVSLVRSNRYRNCGFLKLPNRINVLLSRAKHGMYIIGDASTASTAPMWSSIIQVLEENRNIGPNLELHCSRHPEVRSYVSRPEDFATHAPEGGCAQKCELRLDCGHSCPVKCHAERLHKAVKCINKCIKARKCGHACTRRCFEDCGQCQEIVSNVPLPCGHRASRVECRKMDDLREIRCFEPVDRTIVRCGHQIRVRCFENTASMKCFHLCEGVLSCGHVCRKPCWQCHTSDAGNRVIDHGVCHKPCGRPYTTCSHSCGEPCHEGTACPPCDRTCEVRCKHSRCAKKCSEPCVPCAEPCGWGCNHQAPCVLPCAVPCDRIPCITRCKKKLRPCGHQCPGICGERCPDPKYCQICGSPAVYDHEVDLLEFKAYKDIDIDKDPMVFLSCGHFYTASSLDGVMEMSEHYDMDESTGRITGLKHSHRIMAGDRKGCPECRRPLREINRYNRMVKSALLDEATKRFVSHTNTLYAGLMSDIENCESFIDRQRQNFIAEWPLAAVQSKDSNLVRISIDEYRREGIVLQKRVRDFIKSVAREEQPFGRVNNMLAAVKARQHEVITSLAPVERSMIQTGFESRGEVMLLRLTWALLWDLDAICKKRGIDPRVKGTLEQVVASQTERLLKKCDELIDSSQKARFPQQELESRIYHVLFTVLSVSNRVGQGNPFDIPTEAAIRDQAREELRQCEEMCLRHRRILWSLREDIEKAKILVNGGTFYSFVTTEEKRQVYEVMAQQFSGTGHWYYCENNHPFTVGECGLPMEEARCPQCDAPVGGLNHVLAPGMRRADDMDVEFGSAGLVNEN